MAHPYFHKSTIAALYKNPWFRKDLDDRKARKVPNGFNTTVSEYVDHISRSMDCPDCGGVAHYKASPGHVECHKCGGVLSGGVWYSKPIDSKPEAVAEERSQQFAKQRDDGMTAPFEEHEYEGTLTEGHLLK